MYLFSANLQSETNPFPNVLWMLLVTICTLRSAQIFKRNPTDIQTDPGSKYSKQHLSFFFIRKTTKKQVFQCLGNSKRIYPSIKFLLR